MPFALSECPPPCPAKNPSRALANQVLRSGTPIGANYREAFRSRSHAEFAAKCGDGLKELAETDYWLELRADAAVIPAGRFVPLRQECAEPIAIFVTVVTKARQPEAPRPS